jgi:hypothetical protein
MKNKIIYLIALLLLLFYTQVKSQSAANHLHETFRKDNLMEEDLHAFESRAQQKIKDYANYIEIISDKKYDSNLRKEAGSTALKLFSSPETEITESLNKDEKDKSWKTNEYLNALTVSSYQKVTLQIKDLTLTKELQKQKDNTYRGQISFVQTMKGYNKKEEQILLKTSEKKAEIILKKVKKQFGKETEEIWEVFIGNIK